MPTLYLAIDARGAVAGGNQMINVTNNIKNSTSSMGLSMQSTLSMIKGWILELTAGYGALSTAQEIFHQGAQRQVDQAVLGNLLGNQRAGIQLYKELQDVAMNYGVTMDDLTASARRLVNVGVAPERIADIVKTLQGTSIATGNSIDQLTTKMMRFQEIESVSAREVTMLSRQGVDAWHMLAKSAGTDVDTMMRLVKMGAVDSKVAFDVIMDGMKKKYQSIGEDIRNMPLIELQRAGQELLIILGDLGEVTMKPLGDGLHQVVDLLKEVHSWLEKNKKTLQESVESGLTIIGVMTGQWQSIRKVIGMQPNAPANQPAATTQPSAQGLADEETRQGLIRGSKEAEETLRHLFTTMQDQADAANEMGNSTKRVSEEQRMLNLAMKAFSPLEEIAANDEEEFWKSVEHATTWLEKKNILLSRMHTIQQVIVDARFNKQVERETVALRDQAVALTMNNQQAEVFLQAQKIRERGREEGASKEQIDKAVETNKQLLIIVQHLRDIHKAAEDMGTSVANAFEDFLTGAKSAKDAVKALFMEIEKEWLQLMVTQPLQRASASLFSSFLGSILGGSAGAGAASSGGGSHAMGDVFQNGVNFFGNGGEVNFPMAFGSGSSINVAGEHGPEVIMPVGRDAQGRMGVSGGRTIIQQVHIHANDYDSFKRSDRQIAARMKRMVE